MKMRILELRDLCGFLLVQLQWMARNIRLNLQSQESRIKSCISNSTTSVPDAGICGTVSRLYGCVKSVFVRVLTAHRLIDSTEFPLVIQLPVVLKSFSDLRPDELGRLLAYVVFKSGTEHDDVCVEGATIAEIEAGGRVAGQYCVSFDLDLY